MSIYLCPKRVGEHPWPIITPPAGSSEHLGSKPFEFEVWFSLAKALELGAGSGVTSGLGVQLSKLGAWGGPMSQGSLTFYYRAPDDLWRAGV